jgi:hypothetical protein
MGSQAGIMSRNDEEEDCAEMLVSPKLADPFHICTFTLP